MGSSLFTLVQTYASGAVDVSGAYHRTPASTGESAGGEEEEEEDDDDDDDDDEADDDDGGLYLGAHPTPDAGALSLALQVHFIGPGRPKGASLLQILQVAAPRGFEPHTGLFEEEGRAVLTR